MTLTPLAQTIIQICLFLAAAIAILGGTLQLTRGRPEGLPAHDNVHRFMAGIYFSASFIAIFVATTIERYDTLLDLLALQVFLGGVGRLISIRKRGLPKPHGLWLGYLVPELILPIVIWAANHLGR